MKHENPGTSEWQTIETAQRDGQAILAYDPIADARVVIYWEAEYREWVVSWNGEINPDCTYWMPLPEPPR